MINSAFQIYKTVRPGEMDAKWCNDSVSWLRRDWRPIVNIQQNAVNKSYLFSRQDMWKTKGLFKKEGDFYKLRNGEFPPLPIFENVINIFTEEITKNPPKAELTATDPSADLDRKYDLELFKTKGKHEANVNSINRKVGAPPYRVPKSKFKGSLGEFENTDLDPNDPDDQKFFAQNNRMKYEISGQSLVNNIMELGRFDEDTVQDFVIDILADKVICMDVYVDKLTGEIKYDYLYPETCRGLFGKKSDNTDAICIGYEKSVTVGEWLGKVGNNFVWDRDWRKLLWAINYRANQVYTGFIVNNVPYECNNNLNWGAEAGIPLNATSNLLNWNLAYTYEIYMGKIQWQVPQVTSNYKYKKDSFGDMTMPASMPNDWQISTQEEEEGYAQESFYQWQTYESYYIATSTISQWIYNWGKVYHQLLHGSNDQYSSYTIQYYRKRGLSAIQLCQPYIELANDAFYKMVWAVYEAHPDWEVYQVEELTALAKAMYTQSVSTTGSTSKTDVQSQLKNLIKYFKDNLVKLKAIPRVDGKPMVNLNNTPSTEKRGLDPIAIAMQAVCQWAENQIMLKLGINDLRQGNIENAREGFKQNELETKYSMNVTGYVYRMVSYMKLRVATTTLLTAQDIIRFGDSLPYRWIRTLIGEDNFEGLKSIKDFAAHRFGITVQDLNIAMDRQRINQAADLALDKGDGRGGLSFDQWFFVTQVEDYKAAAKKLSLEKMKAAKKLRAQQVEDMKLQHQQQMELQDRIEQVEKTKGDLVLQKANIDALSAQYVADKNYSAKVNVKEMTNNAEAPKQDAKATATKDIDTNKANLKGQEALTA